METLARITVAAGITTPLVAIIQLQEVPRLWVIVLIPLVVTWGAYRSTMMRAADGYGLALRVCFDLHRFDLLKALHLPLPKNPKAERELNLRSVRVPEPRIHIALGLPA